MKTNVLLVAAVAGALAVTEWRASAQDAALRPQASEVGRYQLVASLDGRIFLLDTATGQCWSRTSGGDWRDEGNPTQATTARTARVAPTLDLPEKSVEMTVMQREERAVPGSDGSVRIRLGDITEGQVLLSVITADDDYVLERTSVAQGDKVEFSVEEKRYTLNINELRLQKTSVKVMWYEMWSSGMTSPRSGLRSPPSQIRPRSAVLRSRSSGAEPGTAADDGLDFSLLEVAAPSIAAAVALAS